MTKNSNQGGGPALMFVFFCDAFWSVFWSHPAIILQYSLDNEGVRHWLLGSINFVNFRHYENQLLAKISTYTLNSEPKALTGDKSEGIKSRGAAEAFIRGFSPVKAECEEFNVLILSYTRELSRPFKENKG